MKLFILILCVLSTISCGVHSQQSAKFQQPPAASDAVIKTLYNRTFSDIGAIKHVRIYDNNSRHYPFTPEPGSPTLINHREVWRIIETSKLSDDKYRSVPCSVSPNFTLEYENGMTAHVDMFTASIYFPDGTYARFVHWPSKVE